MFSVAAYLNKKTCKGVFLQNHDHSVVKWWTTIPGSFPTKKLPLHLNKRQLRGYFQIQFMSIHKQNQMVTLLRENYNWYWLTLYLPLLHYNLSYVMTWADCFRRFSVECNLTFSASQRPTSEHPYYVAYKHLIASAITCHELMVIALTWERAYGSCQSILFISSLQLLWKQTEILGRTLKTWIGFCMHTYLC